MEVPKKTPQQKWNEKNKEKRAEYIKIYHAQYYLDKKEDLTVKYKQYYLEKKEEIKRRNLARYYEKKLAQEPLFKI